MPGTLTRRSKRVISDKQQPLLPRVVPTLADTFGDGADLDRISLELCLRYVDEIMLRTESKIEASIRLLFEQHRGKKVVAVVCGRNIDPEVFKPVIGQATGNSLPENWSRTDKELG